MIVDLNYYQDIKYLAFMSVNSNKNKYWADEELGSDLFKLNKSKIDKSTPNEVKRIIEESLSWIENDGLAKSIEVSAKANGKNEIDWTIEMLKPNNETELIKGVWQGV